MLGFDAIGSQPIASGRIRTLRALMAQMFGGPYVTTGTSQALRVTRAATGKFKIRAAKFVLQKLRVKDLILGR